MPTSDRAIRLAIAIGALAFFRFADVPLDPRFHLCGFLWLTGRPCPLCGMTRAFSLLAKGDWSHALQFNFLSPLALALLLATVMVVKLPQRAWSAVFAVFVSYGALRACSIVP